MRAILTGNDPIPNSPSADFKHLTSALIINSLSGYLHNITCSSDTETHIQQLKIAGKERVSVNLLKIMILSSIIVVVCGHVSLFHVCD